MAMASAAALELRPLCPVEGFGARELCWMTGAGEPVGSEVSFILSSAAATEHKGGEAASGCRLRGTLRQLKEKLRLYGRTPQTFLFTSGFVVGFVFVFFT